MAKKKYKDKKKKFTPLAYFFRDMYWEPQAFFSACVDTAVKLCHPVQK
jgi:hypothetical protein